MPRILVPAQKTLPLSTPAKPAAIIIAQGKVLDFIDGITQREKRAQRFGMESALVYASRN